MQEDWKVEGEDFILSSIALFRYFLHEEVSSAIAYFDEKLDFFDKHFK